MDKQLPLTSSCLKYNVWKQSQNWLKHTSAGGLVLFLLNRGRKRQRDPQILQVDGLRWVDQAQFQSHWTDSQKTNGFISTKLRKLQNFVVDDVWLFELTFL